MPIKIVDLTAEEAPSNDDLIVVRDNLTNTTRKVTRATLFKDPPIEPGAITNSMLAPGSVSKDKLGEDAKISVRLSSIGSPSTLTPNVDDFDIFAVTSLGQTLTIAAPTGAPLDGQGMMFRFKDNGTARTLSWNAIYRAIGITMPTATVANKTFYITARWNANALKWDVLSVGREA